MPRLEANGLTFHVQQAGSGPDVVLIHGVTGDLSIWFLCKAMVELARTHRVTAFDLRGHGYSDSPPAGYTSADHAGDVEGVVEHLVERGVGASLHVHGEAVEQRQRLGLGDRRRLRHLPQRLERRRQGRVAPERQTGEAAKLRQPFTRALGLHPHAVAENLAVHDVVAVPAPGVQPPGRAALAPAHQALGEREALGARPDDRLDLAGQVGAGCDRDAHAAAFARSPRITPAVALAEPTTPGTPAPGWVPAPTK